MNHHSQISTLNANCLTQISSFLDYSELLNLIYTAKPFQFLSNDNAIWKIQSNNYFPLDLLYLDEDFPSQEPKQQFIGIFNKYVQIRAYTINLIQKVHPEKETKDLVELFEKNFFKNSKALDQIHKLILDSYKKIPLDCYLFYRMLNGQNQIGGKFKDTIALLGGYKYYDNIHTFFVNPFLKAPSEKFQFIPFTVCAYTESRVFVDVHNALQKGHGSLFIFQKQMKENGKSVFEGYIFKPSLLKFLGDLQDCSFNKKEKIIDHFDSFNHPLSDVTTNGIRIRTSAIYDCLNSQYDGHLFTYQIRISPNGVQGKWKLTTRHWIIDDNGEVNEVKGPGVIGFYPEVFEGCKEFTYQSCTPMHGFNGTMKGELYFENLETGEEIAAIVGEFKLELPKGSALIKYYPDDNTVAVVAESEL